MLAKFNVCHDYIKWIKTLYSDPKITVKNNGSLTEYINVSRSIKQVCPVSASLFILCIEMLSRKISTNNSIKGIKQSTLVGTRDKSEIKTVQYADDLIILIKDEKSLQIAINTIEQISDSAGPTLNMNK